MRTFVFTFLRALAGGDYDGALLSLGPLPEPAAGASSTEAWTADRLRRGHDAYRDAGHARIRLDPEARNRRHTYVVPSEDKKMWTVQQMLVDPEDANDWVAEFTVDLVRSREEGAPAILLRRLGPLVEVE